MIDQLKSLAVFSAVVDCGSFRAASRQLGMAPSRVSETVARLEAQLGVTLIYRTTRKLSLSSAGEALFDQVRDMLRAAERGLNAVALKTDEPKGALRICVPAFLTTSKLVTELAAFATRYPGVALSIAFSDHPLDVVDNGFDVAIRASCRLSDPSQMRRELTTEERWLVASPSYAMTRQEPKTPAELGEWDWVHYEMRRGVVSLVGPDGISQKVVGKSHVVVDSAASLLPFVVAGLGASVLPRHQAAPAVASGKLVRILEDDWKLDSLVIYAFWAGEARRASLRSILVEHLAEQLRGGV